MADSETEYDLDTLAAMLNDDDEEGWTTEQPSTTPGQTDSETNDLDTLTGMLDDDEKEGSASQTQPFEDSGNVSIADLGLVMSDEDDQQPSTSNKPSSFSTAFANSKFSKNKKGGGQSSQSQANTDVDPLEAELRQMEERMNLLKEQLSKKKKLNHNGEGGSRKRFTKLTNHSNESKHTVRTLSEKEASKLYEKYGRKGTLRAGDTDSEDEEDLRNPFEQKYNSCGRDMKKRIAHDSDQSSYSPSQMKKEEILSRVKTASTPSQGPGWKGIDGSLVSLKHGGNNKVATENDKNVTVDFYSGIRIVNPVVSAEAMRERMDSRKMVRMSAINLHVRCGEIEGDWVTIGVLISKSEPKTSQKGSQYSIWKLSDLQDCTKTVALFLFTNAHKNLWKHSVGTVIGLLNPAIMKDRQGDKNTDMLTLSIYDSNKIMLMGSAKDLGWCKGRTKTNGFCKYFVNKASCEFCMYHIQREYQKSSAKRSDIQSSFTRVDPKRRLQEKVLGKDQVFYGGQLYTAPSPGSMPKQSRANRSKDLATLNSLKMKLKTQELKEEDKKNSFVLKHMSNSEIDAVKKVAQTNDNFSEKLLAPTPGARNLLRHMAKEETQKKVEKGEYRSATAKDLLCMTHQLIQSKKNNVLANKSRTSLSPSSSQSRPSFSPAAGPKLGRGIEPGGDIDLEISPTYRRLDPAKARAMAKIHAKGGIQAAKPNVVRNTAKASDPEFQDKVRKRMSTGSNSEDDEKQQYKKSRLTETTESKESPRSRLGSIDINSDKFKAMLEQKSRHTNLVDEVENEALEKYYQGLEKKEMMEDKMASIMEIPTTAYVCVKCRYMAQSPSDFCREERHPLKAIKVKKRFFECRNCKRRTTSLDKLPRNPCSNCDHSSWQRCAMGKAKNGPKLDSEILSLRGDELKHYSGNSDKVYLHV